MISRLIAWLQRRQAKAHCADEIVVKSQERMDTMEHIVHQEQQDRQRVNLLYDRIAGKGRELDTPHR